MKRPGTKPPVLIQAADVLRRARRLPVGPARNDLRQLARGLVNLHRLGVNANVQIVDAPTRQ
jgi:hypothetical protein